MSNEYLIPLGFDEKHLGKVYGELTEREYDSKTTGAIRKCWVYTPPKYDAIQRYPILYLLHGIGGIHDEWLHGNPNEIISNLIHTGKVKPFIAVIPNVRASEDDSVPDNIFTHEHFAAFDHFINDLRDDLMPYIEENYNISPNRKDRAIAGLSMGGRESLFIITQMADTFGSVGAFCPAPGLLPTEIHNQKGQLTKKALTLSEPYKQDTFVLINTGDEDDLINPNPQIYHETLLSNGVCSNFYSTSGGHDFTVWKHGLYQFVKEVFKKEV